MTVREILLALAIKYNGDWESIYTAIKEKEIIEPVEYEGKFITIVDKEYPSSLKSIYKPPFVLFYEGNIDLLSENEITAITGTKTPTDLKAVKYIVDNEYHVVINSDMEGVEDYSLKYAKELKLNTICVGHKKVGTLNISEIPYLKDASFDKERIIAGLCTNVKCGELEDTTLIAKALSFGKEIFAIPTPLFTSFKNNQLICEGAEIIF